MEKQGITTLVLLDPSAAFDTVDHSLLLDRMEKLFVVHGFPLKRFKSYLSGRTQRVHINQKLLSLQHLKFGVPQGSVLGPLLFLIYTLPLGNIIRRHGMELHMYAYDNQIYTSICPPTPDVIVLAVSRIEDCITEVQN